MKFPAYLASPWSDVDNRQSSHGDSVTVLDGIRGLAVMIVIASHTGSFAMEGQGSVGVFLFFTLSGFVLTLPFADRPGRIFQRREIWRYAANRVLRIVPAFIVAVLVIAWQLQRPWNWVWLNLSFHSGWNHFWSVAEEVRFYFLFPFVIALLALLPPRRVYHVLALTVLILLAWQFQGLHRINLMMTADGPAVFFYFYFFLTGMLACLIYRALQHLGINGGHFVDAATPFIILAVFYLNGWLHSELWCGLFLLLLVGTANSDGAFTSRFLRSWVMRHLGLLSYSLYLFHVPVTLSMLSLNLEGAVLFAAVFSGTYVVAVVSYLLIEKPFLMLKPKRIARIASPELPSSAPVL